MTKQIVYIITKGDYSDYHIEAVFLDKEAADKYIEVFGGDLGEWEAGTTKEVLKPYFTIDFEKDNNGKISDKIYSDYDDGALDKNFNGKESIENGPFCLRIVVRAKNEETAKKIAYDKRAQYIAEKEGFV